MKTCIYCGSALKEHAKFCTHCGKEVIVPLEEKEISIDNKKYEQKSKDFSFRWILLGMLLALMAGGYYWYQYQTPSYDAISMLEEAAGAYYDNTGRLSGGVNEVIRVEASGGHLNGATSNGRLSFDLLIEDYNRYFGTFQSGGVATEVTAKYDPASRRLIFTRKNSPLDFYIAKR